MEMKVITAGKSLSGILQHFGDFPVPTHLLTAVHLVSAHVVIILQTLFFASWDLVEQHRRPLNRQRMACLALCLQPSTSC